MTDNADKIPLIECYGPVMQGEGYLIGRPTWFIRTGACDYRCHYCFGWYPTTGKQPRITMSFGPKKNLGKVKVGDELLTLNERGEIVETTVQRVLRRKVSVWLRIKIAGQKYYVTPEHPFFTTRGLVAAEKLRVGDMILHEDPSAIASYRKKGARNPMRRPEVHAKQVANTDWKAMGRKLARTVAAKKRAGTYRSSWQLMTKKQQAEFSKKQSLSKQGPNNPNWNPNLNNRNLTEFVKEFRANPEAVCERCGRTREESRLEIHHRDHNRRNDCKENFEIVCHQCHSKEHRRGYNFWQAPRRDGKIAPKAMGIRNGMLVQKIQRVDRNGSSYYPSTRPKPLPVVNLTCSPYPSFLADGMWVHNCDSMHAVDPHEIEQRKRVVSAKQLGVETRKAMGVCPMVTVSGGNPALWNLEEFVREMHGEPYKTVAVETQGSVYKFWLVLVDYLTVSPKGPGMIADWEEGLERLIRFLHALEIDTTIYQYGKPKVTIKVPVFDRQDLSFCRRVLQLLQKEQFFFPLYLSVGNPRVSTLAPRGEGDLPDRTSHRNLLLRKYEELFDIIAAEYPDLAHCALLPQMHVLLHGNELQR